MDPVASCDQPPIDAGIELPAEPYRVRVGSTHAPGWLTLWRPVPAEQFGCGAVTTEEVS